MTEYDFTLTGFRAWAEDHNPDAVAGYTCTDGTCPGHEFWKETLGDEYEYIDHPAHTFIKIREETDWMNQFAWVLDARYGEPTGPKGLIQPVTYQQVLDVLASISTDERCVTFPSVSNEAPAML